MWFKKFAQLMCSSCEPQVLFNGTSDVIVVRNVTNGQLMSTPFYVCFGTEVTTEVGERVIVSVDDVVQPFNFILDSNGYIHPNKPSTDELQRLDLNPGKNIITYTIGNKGQINFAQLSHEIYLYESTDKLVVSDVDGTLTKSDVQGMYRNYHGEDFLHEGYASLMQSIYTQGYKVVWMTMRSLPMYEMSKKYIRNFVKIDGPLIMEPEDLMLAAKKEAVTRTSDRVKATTMINMKEVFPKNTNPFAGGFGNRDNDSIAYSYVGMDPSSIYQIDVEGRVHRLSENNRIYRYSSIEDELEEHFPRITRPKVKLYPR